MIEFDGGNLRGVEGDRVFLGGASQKVLFFDEQEFRLRVDETLNQPGTGHAIHLHIALSNPLHGHLTWSPTRIDSYEMGAP